VHPTDTSAWFGEQVSIHLDGLIIRLYETFVEGILRETSLLPFDLPCARLRAQI